jgi:hypothetical protein
LQMDSEPKPLLDVVPEPTLWQTHPTVCSLDSNAVAALAACAAAVIALVTAGVLIWQTYFGARVQAFLQLVGSWESESMLTVRRRAAKSLLAKVRNPDVDRVLDFFETIAGLFCKPRGVMRFRVIPDDWARHTFYWYAACYWGKSRDYIDAVRQRPTGQAAWEDFCDLIPRWIAKEGAPTPQDIEDFLADAST